MSIEKCDELPMLNFNMSCICKNKRHKKKKIIVCHNSYSFTCTSCAKVHKHNLQLAEPLSLYCKDDIVKYATLSCTYNRQTINFCNRCINHRLGQTMTGFLSLCSSFQKFPQEVYCTIESWGDTHKKSVCLKSINGLLNH